jgi:hypothetical protein
METRGAQHVEDILAALAKENYVFERVQ